MIAEKLEAITFKILMGEFVSYVKSVHSNISIKSKFNIEAAYQKCKNVENVKTIWQVDKSVNLNGFYHPSKIRVKIDEQDSKDIVVDSLSVFPENSKVVIQGTAGQGKSILLRYLAGKALVNSSKIPIFVELRKVSDSKSIEELIIDALSELDIDIDSKDMRIFFESNKFALLFDAFDEVPESNVLNAISYLEKICHKYPSQFLLITSRPNAEVQKIPAFNVYNLLPLSMDDFEPMLNKFFSGNHNIVEQIIGSLKGDSNNVVELITTPLLLTLLAITYKSYNKIPTQLNEFYENIFHVLVNRHDSSKPGFVREYKSKLNERELENLFCVFCFFSMINEKTSLTRRDAVSILKKSSELSRIYPSSELSFLSDCIKNTCLIVEEGFVYHFVHKSIREYHSAKFISESEEGLKLKFYGSALKLWHKYRVELEFLKVIDELPYKKMFLYPMMKEVYDFYKGINLKKLSYEVFFENSCISFSSSGEVDETFYVSSFSDSIKNVNPLLLEYHSGDNGYDTTDFLGLINLTMGRQSNRFSIDFLKKFKSLKKELLKRENTIYIVSMSDFLSVYDNDDVIFNKVESSISNIIAGFEKLQDELNERENLINNMDFFG
ncbi:NACHT domain-containing protein [Shewanella algae]|uniref:NACHT domain-containing protein n=1 Tax=Shewanella algae TaxID=38313 RepID=UPI003D7D141A